jgi:hypothetical protein
VLALLERIRQQDAGEIEPPAIALSGQPGRRGAAEAGGDLEGDGGEAGEGEDDVDIVDDLDVSAALLAPSML